jgi:hypothetical protein
MIESEPVLLPLKLKMPRAQKKYGTRRSIWPTASLADQAGCVSRYSLQASRNRSINSAKDREIRSTRRSPRLDIIFGIGLGQALGIAIAFENGFQNGRGRRTHRAVVQIDFMFGNQKKFTHFISVMLPRPSIQSAVGQFVRRVRNDILADILDGLAFNAATPASDERNERRSTIVPFEEQRRILTRIARREQRNTRRPPGFRESMPGAILANQTAAGVGSDPSG